MDLTHVESDYVLHLIDETTRFSSFKLVGKRATTQKVWEPIMQGYSSVYTGMSHAIAFDEEKQHSYIFGKLSTIYDIDMQKNDPEAPNSLGIGEIYHDPLCKTLFKLREDFQNLKKDFLL